MGAEGIFLIRDGQLMVLDQRPYDSEELLQAALADFPAVLAGSSTADGSPRPLLLVSREMGVPKVDGAPSTWSLDHLFVDSEGVPVVVEVKRSTDTRIRREVVGQMLDYAANGVRYWPAPDLRASFEVRAAEMGSTGDERLRELVPDVEPEEFWQRVADNLKSGRIRMVFVADHLPPELVRVIEFLNEQMSPAEVLGVEVPQFVGEGHQVLVPRVIGRTTTAVAAKQTSGGTWDEESLLAVAAEHRGAAQAAFFRRLFDHVRLRGERFSWGRGVSPGVSGWYALGGVSSAVWTANAGAPTADGRSTLYFWLPDLRQSTSPGTFDAFVSALEAIPSYAPKMAAARRKNFDGKYPSLIIDDLVNRPSEVEQIFAAIDELISSAGQALTRHAEP